MKRLFHRRISVDRFLVEAEELALAALENADALAVVSNGNVTAQTAHRIRELVAQVRASKPQRTRRPQTARQLARESLALVARTVAIARDAARARRDEQLANALRDVSREHPLRARAVSRAACSLEAYACVLREHTESLRGLVDESTPVQLEAHARQIRAESAAQRHERTRELEITATREKALSEVGHITAEIRAAFRVLASTS